MSVRWVEGSNAQFPLIPALSPWVGATPPVLRLYIAEEATGNSQPIASHYDPGGAPSRQRRPLTERAGKEETCTHEIVRMDRAMQI